MILWYVHNYILDALQVSRLYVSRCKGVVILNKHNNIYILRHKYSYSSWEDKYSPLDANDYKACGQKWKKGGNEHVYCHNVDIW